MSILFFSFVAAIFHTVDIRTQSASSNVAPYSWSISYLFHSFFPRTLDRDTCNRFLRTLANTCRCSDRASSYKVSTKEYDCTVMNVSRDECVAASYKLATELSV